MGRYTEIKTKMVNTHNQIMAQVGSPSPDLLEIDVLKNRLMALGTELKGYTTGEFYSVKIRDRMGNTGWVNLPNLSKSEIIDFTGVRGMTILEWKLNPIGILSKT
jgi:hypothetical protein